MLNSIISHDTSIAGTKWQCNMCNKVLDLPVDFDYDALKRRVVDRSERTELNSSVIEYVAPREYSVCRLSKASH